MFQKSIVEKVPVNGKTAPDLFEGYWGWNVFQFLFNEASMLSAVRYSQGCNSGKKDGGFQFSSPHILASFVNKRAKSVLEVFDLVCHFA